MAATILSHGRWDANAPGDIARNYVVETMATASAMPENNETGFLKQSKASCDASCRYTRSAGKVINCQIGVIVAYVLRRGEAFIGRALYLP